MARVKEIARADTVFEAERLVSLLGEVGIEAEVDGVHVGTMFGSPPLFGIRVLVAEPDGERAAAVLAELAPPPDEDDEDVAEREVGEAADDSPDEPTTDDVEGAAGPVAGAAGAAVAGPVSGGADVPPLADADPLAPWPAAKAERWARRLLRMAIASLLFLGAFAPIGLVMLVYVAVKCVDPPPGVHDAPRARRSLRWARVTAGIGGLLVFGIGLLYYDGVGPFLW